MNNVELYGTDKEIIAIIIWCRQSFGKDVWPPSNMQHEQDWCIERMIWDEDSVLMLSLTLNFNNKDNATLCILRWR